MASIELRREGSFRFNLEKDWLTSSIRGVGEVGDMKPAERWADPRLSPEQHAAREMVTDRLRADRDRHFGLNGIFYGLLVTLVGGTLVYAMARGEDDNALDAVAAGSGDTGPTPDLITPASAGVVETLGPTPTQMPPTEIFIPATATLRPPTEIVKTPTARPTERINPTEKPLAGQIFDLDCTGMSSWAECQKQIDQRLLPLLVTDWGSGNTIERIDTTTEGITGRSWREQDYWNPKPLGSFKLKWKRPNGEISQDEGIVFGIQGGSRRKIQPALSLISSGGGENLVGLSWSVGYVDGGVITVGLETSFDLTHKLFVRGEEIYVINVPLEFQWDSTANFLLSQPDINTRDGIEPLRLVDFVGLAKRK